MKFSWLDILEEVGRLMRYTAVVATLYSIVYWIVS